MFKLVAICVAASHRRKDGGRRCPNGRCLSNAAVRLPCLPPRCKEEDGTNPATNLGGAKAETAGAVIAGEPSRMKLATTSNMVVVVVVFVVATSPATLLLSANIIYGCVLCGLLASNLLYV